jgi:hypothetical protein
MLNAANELGSKSKVTIPWPLLVLCALFRTLMVDFTLVSTSEGASLPTCLKKGTHKSSIVRIVRAMNFNWVRGMPKGPEVEGRSCLENRPVIVSDSSDMAAALPGFYKVKGVDSV